MNSLLDAYRIMERDLKILPKERIDSRLSVGRVLAEPIYAPRDYPHFSQSAMDGYVVHRDDLGPTTEPLQIAATIKAGETDLVPVRPKCPQRIFTGAPIPEDGAAVRIQENVVRSESGTVEWTDNLPAGSNIRQRGTDIRQGQALFQKGHAIITSDLAVLTNLQIKEVLVHRLPSIGLLTSGDELISFEGAPPRDGEVVDGNRGYLAHQLSSHAEELAEFGVVTDSEVSVTSTLDDANRLDLIVACGGMSVGDYDVLGQVVRASTKTLFYKVAVKPGKPILLGQRTHGLLIGLPGNPVSVFVGYYLFVLPILKRLKGDSSAFPWASDHILATAMEKGGARLEFLRGRVDRFGRVSIFSHQGSAAISGLNSCNCLVVRPAHAEAKKIGDKVSVYRLDGWCQGCSFDDFKAYVWPKWSN